MNRRRFLTTATTALLFALLCIGQTAGQTAKGLPARLTDQEFWKLSSESSEQGGVFHSENLVSNEIKFQTIIPSLIKATAPGRAYVGVGSEQNFTYIAATRPAIAFIVDIRRGNLDLHLIYKALFEMSANRVEFVSRLFSRDKPPILTPNSTATEIFAAFKRATPNRTLFNQNLAEIKAALTTKHGFQLSASDLQAIDSIYNSWFRFGPEIRYELNGGGSPGGVPTYADLMMAADLEGQNRSYLGSDEAFRFVKDMHARNMIIPVVGNFGGPKAIRAVAAYLKQKQTPVAVFYTSNVEQYLRQDGIWTNFCSSAAMLPMDGKSVFLRTLRAGFAGQSPVVGANGNFNLEVAPMTRDVASCGK
jgi:hypothetical protein